MPKKVKIDVDVDADEMDIDVELGRTSSLINRSAVKQHTLKVADQRWQNGRMTRVSDSFLRGIEAEVRNLIRKRISQHPSIGKTIRWE
jgi:hypothetical protein